MEHRLATASSAHTAKTIDFRTDGFIEPVDYIFNLHALVVTSWVANIRRCTRRL